MGTNYLKAKGWLTEPERELLRELASGVPDNGIVVNIGVEYGASLHCLRAGNDEAWLVGIDIIGDEKLEGDPDADIIEAPSSAVLHTWRKVLKLADLVFVDGDHTYLGVVADCGWADLVKVGGVIAFHDCYRPGTTRPHEVVPAVNRAVEEWAKGTTSFSEQDPVDSIRVFVRLDGPRQSETEPTLDTLEALIPSRSGEGLED